MHIKYRILTCYAICPQKKLKKNLHHAENKIGLFCKKMEIIEFFNNKKLRLFDKHIELIYLLICI